MKNVRRRVGYAHQNATRRPHARQAPTLVGTAHPTRILLLFATFVTLCGGSLKADANTIPFDTPAMFDDIGIEQKPGATVPLDLTFRDESGAEVPLGDYFGEKPVLLHLVYFECPMLCNMTMDGLIRTLRTMSFDVGREFTVLTVSFDHREGPKLAAGAKQTALRRYGRRGAERGWHFLTGDQPSIRALTDAVGFRFAYNPKIDQYAHAAGIMVLTPDGHVSRYFNGMEFAARDLRLGLVEASQNEIGSVTDQVMLLCYQYDPSNTTYGLRVHYTLQVLGMGTVVVLAASVVTMLRRERKRNSESRIQNPEGRGMGADDF